MFLVDGNLYFFVNVVVDNSIGYWLFGMLVKV